MTSLQKIDLGGVTVECVDGGTFRLDGGAMFGMVPKAVWEKKVTPDSRNRIELSCNVPLIQTGKRNVLVDLGCGDKLDEKGRDLYCTGGRHVYQALASHGLSPEQITDVIFTHLHFDHAGGVTRWKDAAKRVEAVLNFPNAMYHVQKDEWEAARNPNELNRRTYLEENLGPMASSRRVVLARGDEELFPGVLVIRTGGHTNGHQAVVVRGRDAAAYFMGDVLCLTHHIRLAWLTAFDCDTYDSLEAKKKLFAKAADENAYVWMYHECHDLVLRIRHKPNEPEYDFSPVVPKRSE